MHTCINMAVAKFARSSRCLLRRRTGPAARRQSASRFAAEVAATRQDSMAKSRSSCVVSSMDMCVQVYVCVRISHLHLFKAYIRICYICYMCIYSAAPSTNSHKSEPILYKAAARRSIFSLYLLMHIWIRPYIRDVATATWNGPFHILYAWICV